MGAVGALLKDNQARIGQVARKAPPESNRNDVVFTTPNQQRRQMDCLEARHITRELLGLDETCCLDHRLAGAAAAEVLAVDGTEQSRSQWREKEEKWRIKGERPQRAAENLHTEWNFLRVRRRPDETERANAGSQLMGVPEHGQQDDSPAKGSSHQRQVFQIFHDDEVRQYIGEALERIAKTFWSGRFAAAGQVDGMECKDAAQPLAHVAPDELVGAEAVHENGGVPRPTSFDREAAGVECLHPNL